MTDFAGALQDMNAALAGAAPPNDADVPVEGPFADVLRDIAAAKPAPDKQAPAAVQPYSGSILPFSQDAQGKVSFDPNAGIVGMGKNLYNAAISGITAPADAIEGRLPPNDPNLENRALDFATMFTPGSAAARAGEAVPGAMTLARVPSTEQLKAAATRGYDAARSSGLEVNPEHVANLAVGLQNDLTRKGFGSAVAPTTHDILDKVVNPPTGAIATLDDLEAIRSNLGNVSGSPRDATAGGIAKRAVDDFVNSLDPSSVVAGTSTPEAIAALRDARGNYAAAMRSNSLTGDLDKATTGILERAENRAHASHSGTNIDNAIRQRVASFLQEPGNIAGFSQPEIDALQSVVTGGPIQNAARRVGNLFGGGGGLGQLAAGFAGATIGSHLAGSAEGGALGAMLPTALGASAKGLENTLSRRALNNADEMVRTNSPLARAMAAEGAMAQPAMSRNSAVLRSVLPGLLAPVSAPPQSLAEILARGA